LVITVYIGAPFEYRVAFITLFRSNISVCGAELLGSGDIVSTSDSGEEVEENAEGVKETRATLEDI